MWIKPIMFVFTIVNLTCSVLIILEKMSPSLCENFEMLILLKKEKSNKIY